MATSRNKSVTKSEPVKPATSWPSLFGDFDRMLDNYFNHKWPRLFGPEERLNDLWGTYEMRSPSMDVIDRDNEVVVRIELPGVDKKDIDVSVSNDTLTVKGTSSKELSEEKGNYYRSEIRKGAISRTISLPPGVDSSKAEAKFRDGLLELTMPKNASSKRKTIKVS